MSYQKNYDQFVFQDIRAIGRAWYDANPGADRSDIEQTFEKVGDYAWRMLVDGKSLQQCLDEVFAGQPYNPADYLPPAPPRPAADLSAWYPSGPIFRSASGAPARWKMVTAFDSPRLVKTGEFDKLKRYARWTRDAGGNGWRGFGGWARTGFDYRNVGDYFTNVLPGWAALLGDEGLRGEFVFVCDGIPSTFEEQYGFINRGMDVLIRFPWIVGTLANEPWKNGLDPQRFDTIRRQGFLLSKGAPPAGTTPYPYVPSLGWSDEHPPRENEWFRYPGKDAYEIRNNWTHDVVVPTEGIGFSEGVIAGSRTNDARKAFTMGHSSAMFCPGQTAHGDTNTMQLCEVPGPNEDRCVRELFRGIDLVPPDAPTWTYGRYGPDAPPTAMPIEEDPASDRMHAMVGPSGAVVANYFAADSWRPVPRDNWRVTYHERTLVVLER